MKKLSLIALASFGFTMAAHANEVLLVASNKPAKITFRVVHKNQNDRAVFGKLQSMEISNINVPISLGNYDRAGIVIVSANGHELPPTANQFDQAKQCSMTTDKTKSTGALLVTLSSHSISCHSYGGIFG